MNEFDKAIDILVCDEREKHYTNDEIALAYLLAIKALRAMEQNSKEGGGKGE